MNMSEQNLLNDKVFTTIMKSLESFYGLPGQVTGNEFVDDIYYGVLKHLSEREFKSAAASCIKNNAKQYGFFPSPQQLLEYAKGEYRPPGEMTVQADLNIPALESKEAKMSEEDINELKYRGRLQAKILAYGGRFMSTDEKQAFIDSIKLKPTYELEHMANNAENARKAKDPNRAMAHLSESFEKIKERLNLQVFPK